MRFAFLAREIDKEGFGVATYLREIIVAISHLEHDHQILIFKDPGSCCLDKLSNVEIITVSPKINGGFSKLIWDHFSIPRACAEYKVDVVFCPYHVKPFGIPCASVVCVHDMMYHLFPEDWAFFECLYMKYGVNILTRRAQRIVTVSEAARKDFLEFVSFDPKRIDVIHHGVPRDCMPASKTVSPLSIHEKKIPKSFVLYIGGNHPRKNARFILETFGRLSKKIPHSLVSVGSDFGKDRHWMESELASKLQDRFIHLGLVSREQLVTLLQHADIFTFPSLYEGFGLPLLEAMACGCPVICFDTSAMPEVVGDAGTLVTPGNHEEMVEKIISLVSHEERRTDLINKGLERSKAFSWNKSAKELLTVMEKAFTLK